MRTALPLIVLASMLAVPPSSVADEQVGIYSGVVFDPDGRPAAGAMVFAWQGEHVRPGAPFKSIAPVTADEAGRFRLQAHPHSGLWLFARVEGMVSDLESCLTGAGTEIALHLRPAKPVEGAVVDEKGQPIGGAEVSPALLMWPLPGQSVRTDAAGKFRLDALPLELQTIVAMARGLAMKPDAPYIAYPSTIRPDQRRRIVMRPEARIEGVVVDKWTARPVEGIACVLRPKGIEFERAASSGPDGTFVFTGLRGGIYQVYVQASAEPDGWASDAVEVVVRSGQTGPARIEAEKGGLLEVVVTDKQGQAIPGQVHISRLGAGFLGRLVDAPGGSVRVRLPADIVLIFAFAGESTGFIVPADKPVRVVAGQITSVALKADAVRLKGVVRDAQGRPVAGARVHSTVSGGGVATDADGRFSIWVGPETPDQADLNLWVSHPVRGLAGVVSVQDAQEELVVTLAPGVSIAGRLTDAEGKPLAGVGVGIRPDSDFRAKGDLCLTDAQGRYVLRDLPAGREYTIWAGAADYVTAEVKVPTAGRAGLVEAPQIVLMPNDAFVAGIVLDEAGKPVFGALVHCDTKGKDRPPGTAIAITDGDGRFRLPVQPGKPVHLFVAGSGDRFATAEAQPNQAGVKITLYRELLR